MDSGGASKQNKWDPKKCQILKIKEWGSEGGSE